MQLSSDYQKKNECCIHLNFLSSERVLIKISMVSVETLKKIIKNVRSLVYRKEQLTEHNDVSDNVWEDLWLPAQRRKLGRPGLRQQGAIHL